MSLWDDDKTKNAMKMYQSIKLCSVFVITLLDICEILKIFLSSVISE